MTRRRPGGGFHHNGVRGDNSCFKGFGSCGRSVIAQQNIAVGADGAAEGVVLQRYLQCTAAGLNETDRRRIRRNAGMHFGSAAAADEFAVLHDIRAGPCRFIVDVDRYSALGKRAAFQGQAAVCIHIDGGVVLFDRAAAQGSMDLSVCSIAIIAYIEHSAR